MTRNPADGTVKEKPGPVIASSLPAPKINAEEMARLERSREWLKNRREAQ